MADSKSSPVNLFVFVCLLVVIGAGGASLWEDLSPRLLQAEDTASDELATIPEPDMVASADLSTPPPPSESVEITTEVATDAVPSTDEATASTPPQPDTYPEAIKRAEQAAQMGQLAQSQDDWRLVLNRWQQAIALLEAVPTSSPNYGNVAAKLTDYRRNLAYAQGQTTMPLPDNTQTGSIVLDDEEEDEIVSAESSGTAGSDDENSPNDGDNSGSNASEDAEDEELQVFRAAIVRRSGGTPVIQVLFNGQHTVDMIVDTGASGTVITQAMAKTLRIKPSGETNVSTASEANVRFLLGEVDSISVDGAQIQNATVAIAGPELPIGLLGNDFFGQYDVVVRSDVVEFQER